MISINNLEIIFKRISENEDLGAVLLQLVYEPDYTDETHISVDYETIWKNVLQQEIQPPVSSDKKMSRWRVAEAAIILLMLCSKIYIL